MEIRILSSLQAVDGARAAWRALEDRCVAGLTYFQTFSWCRTWLATFAGKGLSHPEVRTVWRGETMVAVWPLMRTRRPLGVSKLETLGAPHSQYGNALCDPDVPEDEIVAALLASLAKGGRVDLAEINGVPSTSALGQALAANSSGTGEGNASSILDLSGYASAEDYTRSLGKLQKRNRNRRRNHLARLGTLEFSVIFADDPAYRAHLATCMAYKRQWLKQTARYSSGFAFENYETFLAALEGDGAARSGACLSVLTCDGRAIAIELGFIHKQHYYAYIGGFDWELRAHSPGKVQMDMTVLWLIENGVTAYDLLGNAADYKQSWSNSSVGLNAYTIPMSLRGRIYAGAWLGGVRPAAKRAYGAIPDQMRKLIPLGQSLD